MNPRRVIVDANIVFKILCAGRSDLRDRLRRTEAITFYSPLFLFVELFKHKERLTEATRISEDSLLAALNALLNRFEFINEANIPVGTWLEARRLCQGVDEMDTPYVALTLHLGGCLWTDDFELKSRLRARQFNDFFEP